jgi:hypothetical protein
LVLLPNEVATTLSSTCNQQKGCLKVMQYLKYNKTKQNKKIKMQSKLINKEYLPKGLHTNPLNLFQTSFR